MRGKASRPEPSRTMETPQILVVFSAADRSCCMLYHVGITCIILPCCWPQPWNNNSRTSSSSFGDGYGQCFCVLACTMRPVDVGSATEHIRINRECAIHRVLRRGKTTIRTHTFSGFEEQPRSHVTYYNRRLRYNGSKRARALRTLAFVAATVLLWLYVCAVLTRR